ncbi:MAG: 2-hydroxyacid dehydrogenase [Bacteroidales bacterium]|nr:2-hydroxyacid dehydrogenase [Bacteroidales bacterium]MBN2697602.1 2-hydroxyacid dehydrogenase [Bacteroidales bacterium]
MKIAVFSSKSYDEEYFINANTSKGFVFDFIEAPLDPRSAKWTKDYDAVCAFVNDDLGRDTLTELRSCGIRLVALRCAGFNHVDLHAARELGIKIMRVPAYSPNAVAEHAVALILTLARKTHKSYNRVRDANFSLERLVGFNISGKRVGVIGTGKIGQVFAGIMQGFGCIVIAYDPYPSEQMEKQGITYTTLKKLFQLSDIISLHCPLVPETHRIINEESLSWMKKGAMLINTSRGKLIHTPDVIHSLREKHLGYLGIDVYSEEEKLFFRDLSERIIDDEAIMQLISFPNVLITSHQGFLTHEALIEIAETTLKNISDFRDQKSSENEVTPLLIN